MSQHEGTFERTAETSLAALGADPAGDALDGWSDPVGAAEALGALGDQGSVVLRAAFDLPASANGAGPEPAAPWWIRVTKGSPEIRTCPAAGASKEACESRRVTRVVVECSPLPDGGDGAVARASLALDRKPGAAMPKLLVAEAWARTQDLAIARVRPVASRLARALSVPASLPQTSSGDEPEAPADEPSATVHVAARALARFSLRGEGPRLVLRDFASRGPREGAGLHLVIGLVLAALAAGAWTMFARSAGAAGPTAAVSLAWLGGSALISLGAVAFLGVARFAMRYAADSEPLVAIGAGKIMVAPWVSRTGAVMVDPEGRFGSGIDLGEVRGVSVQDRKGRHALEVATDHGPIDALLTDDPTVARYFAAALARTFEDLRPEAGPNARQRFRQRAAAAK